MAASGLDFYYIISPEATTNMLTNPSFETGTTTYTAVGGSTTLTRVTTYQRFGKYGLEVVPASGVNDGVYTGSWTLTSSLPYTFSVYGYWASGIPYKINFANTSGTTLDTATTFTGAGKWERKEVTYTPGTTTVRLYITKNNSSATSTATFRIDALQLEQKSYSTTYIDGSLDGGFWNALAHASTSSRYSNYRKGGRKVLLSTYDAYVTDNTGIGTPPVEAVILPYGYAPGGTYQGTLVKPRTMTIGVVVSAGVGASPTAATDLNDWHINMEAIFNLIKPDLVEPQQPFVLGYQHNNNDIEIECVYSGGMDLQNEKFRDISDIAFQVTCPDPFWYEPVNAYALLNNLEYHPYDVDGYIIRARNTDGTWTSLNPSGMSVGARVYCIYTDPYSGNIYVGGEFTTINGVSATNIAMLTVNTGVWSALGTGCNAAVRAIIQPPVGNLLAAGDFTTAGGVTTRCIAQWNGSTWAVVGQAAPFNTTPTPSIRCMAIEPLSGYPLIGGVFLNGTTGSPCTTDYFGRITVTSAGVYAWDTSVRYGVLYGGTAANGCVNDIKCFEKYIYVTGEFDQVPNSVSYNTNGIARLNSLRGIAGSASPWDELGSGFGSTTSEGTNLAIDKNGVVYIAGSFTSINGASITGLAKFDGYQYESASNIATATGVYSDADGGGNSTYSQMFFTNSNQLITNYVSWNNSTGGANQISMLVADRMVPVFGTIHVAGGSSPYFAYNSINGNIMRAEQTASLTYSTTTTVTNSGAAATYPLITITIGTGWTQGVPVITSIRNLTNGRSIYFHPVTVNSAYNEYTLKPREVVRIDCASKTATSSIRGRFVFDPASQDADFYLSPGSNIIEVATGITSAQNAAYPSITIDVQWNETHWTIHGGHE